MGLDETPADVTGLLRRLADGDRKAGEELYERLYPYLRDLARRQVAREPGATLQPTALVHEAWIRLSNGADVSWRDRRHFFATAARAMRYALVDRARRRQAQKRGGRLGQVPLDDTLELFENRSCTMLVLDETLERLAQRDARQARVVELCFFGGLTIGEAAEAMDVSRSTAERSWYMARSWLRSELTG